jgi:tRNA(Ile)-lysidine synthase
LSCESFKELIHRSVIYCINEYEPRWDSPWLLHIAPIAVAVSGGADSMALLLLFKELLDEFGLGNRLIALTIDHNLSCSKEYVNSVHNWICQRQINHEILEWQHAPLQTAIEEKARAARYKLLTDYCRNNRIPRVFVAHHAKDQAETVFMHLMRGSSLRGLGGMRPVSQYNGIDIVRPLLSVDPQDLKDTLRRFNQPYMTDADNLSDQFERVRWRRMITQNREINVCNMAKSAQNLQNIETQIEEAAQKFISANVIALSFPNQKFLELMPVVAQTVLKLLINKVRNNALPCSYRVVEKIYDQVKDANFLATTANGCLIRRANAGMITILREGQRKRDKGANEI